MALLAASALPNDVRATQALAHGLFALAALALALLVLVWCLRLPHFAVRSIRLEGDLTRNSVSTVRANAVHKLAGGFFTIDLERSRSAFESVPWVRRAVVRRVWPASLVVRLQEHQPVAIWSAEDGNDKLVNSHGEVFEANVGDVEDDSLPAFDGPDGSAAQMLAMYQRLRPVLQTVGGEVERLSLTRRGSWRVQMDSGATIELGRGSEEELVARTGRFARTVAQITGRFQRPLVSADLRHAEGYAVRLRGVTTGALARPGGAAAPKN